MPTLSIFKSRSGRHQDLTSLKSETGCSFIPRSAFYICLKSLGWGGGAGGGCRDKQILMAKDRGRPEDEIKGDEGSIDTQSLSD